MNLLILILGFLGVLGWELYTDVKGARQGKNDNHALDSAIRLVLLGAASFFGTTTLLMAISVFCLMGLAYWIVFDLGFNLAQGMSPFYMGDKISDSVLDTIFFDKPILFFVMKIVAFAIAAAALLIPIAPILVLFWLGVGITVIACIASPMFRWTILVHKYGTTMLTIGALGLATVIITGNTTDVSDAVLILTATVPFFTALVAAVKYDKLFKK